MASSQFKLKSPELISREMSKAEPRYDDERVLSIQSSVVHGYVGNKCAVFPLQLHGLDVDPINSVQFSNHTGYPSFSGQKLQGDDINRLVDGLKKNGLLRYTYLLTGYMGSESFITATAELARYLKKENPDLVYICDPVMGDEGKLYVPEAFISIYLSILPLATVLLPNQTEAELLSGISIKTPTEALASCSFFHAKGVKHVVITSLTVALESPGFDPEKQLLICASTSMTDSKEHGCRFYAVPKVGGYYAGTGDLFSSLFLCWFHRTGDFFSSCERTLATMQSVLRETAQHGGKEIRLVQSRKYILHPNPTLIPNVLETLN